MTGGATAGDDDLARMFRDFADGCRSRAPLYARLSASIADDPTVSRLLLHAPRGQRVPVLLFACVHWMLLTEPGHELGRFYPTVTDSPVDGDPYPSFRRLCARHEPRLAGLLAARSTQTNEVGRCAQLVPALGLLADEVGELAMVDVGSSGGLNLLLDRYEYRYEPGGCVGGPSTVVLECGTKGDVPVPHEIPPISARVGLDRSPVDLSDRGAATWLEACVWPDQLDRFHRLHAAIEIAHEAPPTVQRGDAVADLAATIDAVAAAGHPVVCNTWVLNYLSRRERLAYLDELERYGASSDLSWIMAESPHQIDGLPVPADTSVHHLTVLTLVRWRDGVRRVDHLGTTHPHGFWLHWQRNPG